MVKEKYRTSDRNLIIMALDSDERYDDDPQGDPPITVPRYRRGCRVLVTTDFLEVLAAPPDWSTDDTSAFETGVSTVVDTMSSQLASILTGPSRDHAARNGQPAHRRAESKQHESRGRGPGKMSDRARIVSAIARDEAFDDDDPGHGDPPITVRRYRRACRALAITDFSELVTAPAGWPPERKAAFEAGVSAAVEIVISRLAAAVKAPGAL
jgi:hypothetical protein